MPWGLTSKVDHQSVGSDSAKGAHCSSRPALFTTQSSLPAACSLDSYLSRRRPLSCCARWCSAGQQCMDL